MIHNSMMKHDALRKALINTRQMTSLIDREMALSLDVVKRETVNWVPMWVDWGNTVRSDCDTATAIRAISDKNEMLWYVRHDRKKHGYHSSQSDPFSAFKEAMAAWKKRAEVRAEWANVKSLSRDLMLGRENFRVTMNDAEKSALCPLGIKWFRDRMRIAHKQNVSGRTASLLMKVEPQMGFIIHEAAIRTGVWAKRCNTTPTFDVKASMLGSGEKA